LPVVVGSVFEHQVTEFAAVASYGVHLSSRDDCRGSRVSKKLSELVRMVVMYAILETGGKQYKVQPGDVIEVERLDGEVGAAIEFGRVVMFAGDGASPTFGSPAVEGAKVLGEVVEQGKGKKLIIFKYKSKVRYRRKTGHRQFVTKVRVGDIVGPE